MSKNITIQEGGIAKQLTVDKLKTNLVGGGNQLWVPEDEVQLTTKTITENGTYKASDDGYYGYSEVTVSGVGKVSGKDPTTGEDVVVTTDPETGDIVEETVPSSIEVITPPTNPYGIYTNGATIGTEGMVVKAYLVSGGEYGTVPNAKITLDPTTAVYDPSTDIGGSGKATSSLDTSPWQQPIVIGSFATIIEDYTAEGYHYRTTRDYSGSGVVLTVGIESSQERLYLLFASSETGKTATSISTTVVTDPQGNETTRTRTTTYSLGSSYSLNDNTVYYYVLQDFLYSNYNPSVTGPVSTHNGIFGNDNAAAWTMIYGDIEPVQAGSHQEITVSWPRPGDGKVLTDTFEILVAPPYSSGEE